MLVGTKVSVVAGQAGAANRRDIASESARRSFGQYDLMKSENMVPPSASLGLIFFGGSAEQWQIQASRSGRSIREPLVIHAQLNC